MALIAGTLNNASGVRPNTKIILTAYKTTSDVVTLAPDTTIITSATGAYSFECNPSFYNVRIQQPGYPCENVGIIQVYPDSSTGTINDFLTTFKPDDLTPEILKQCIAAMEGAEAAQKAAEAAQKAAEAAASTAAEETAQKVGLMYPVNAGNWSTVAGGQLTEVDRYKAWSYPDNSSDRYAVRGSVTLPITIPAAPDANWYLASSVNLTEMRTDSASQLGLVYKKDWLSGDVIPSDAMKDKLSYWHNGQFYSVGTDTGFISNDFDADLAAGRFVSASLTTQIQQWRNAGDIRGYSAIEGTDCTAAAQLASDSVGICLFPSCDKLNPWIVDSITTTRKTVFKTNGTAYLKAAVPTNKNQPLINLEHDGSVWSWELKIDMNQTSRSGVRVAANDVCAHVDGTNLNADVDAANATSMLHLQSGDNFKGDYRVSGLTNTGHSNESVPRACSVDSGFGDYDINTATMTDNDGGGHVSGGGIGNITSMFAADITDQPIYAVTGAALVVDSLITTRNEEGVVATSGANVTVNSWHHFGTGGWLIGLENCDRVVVGNITVHPDKASGEQFGTGLIRTRAGNVSTGKVYIGSISGVGELAQVMKLDVGAVDYMSISSMEYTVFYNTTKTETTQFCNLSALKQFKFNDWFVRLQEQAGNLIDGKAFTVRLPTANLSAKSQLGDFEFEVLNTTGDANPAGSILITSANQELIESSQLRYQTNVGPYGRENSYAVRASVAAVPTSGYWSVGEYSIRNATTAPFKAYCTIAGTPGTWVTV